ncbi:MAG: hypothetical protein HY043_01945 [Verrucomicrobia bacterium]|nr:hypothetical protein [Verrucomicrobiota bacterium]
MKSSSLFSKRTFRLMAGAWLACVLGGCSTFERDWKNAIATPSPANNPQGAWQGAWLSDVNKHTGSLRCLLTPIDGHNYRARFRATYAKVIRVSYAVQLQAEASPTNTAFHGSANLGWIAGGVYEYAGLATATNFFSTYRCKYDHGTFQMTRPK